MNKIQIQLSRRKPIEVNLNVIINGEIASHKSMVGFPSHIPELLAKIPHT